jgi:hypothetical protein
VKVAYALHVDGRTLAVYEDGELELARRHAQVAAARTPGPVLVVRTGDSAEDVEVIDSIPARDRVAE